jgi:integrase
MSRRRDGARSVDLRFLRPALNFSPMAVTKGYASKNLHHCRLLSVCFAARIGKSKLNYESNAVGLDRNELVMSLVQAGLSGGRDHALACLLALNGLRVSEALNSDVEDLGLERVHRALTITRKGGKIFTIRQYVLLATDFEAMAIRWRSRVREPPGRERPG